VPPPVPRHVQGPRRAQSVECARVSTGAGLCGGEGRRPASALDAHAFITEGRLQPKPSPMNDLILSIYEDFGSPDVTIKFSDRPDKHRR
jgi:threonyl-tRNA synthetase